MADATNAIAAPIEPFAGLVIEGGLGVSEVAGFGGAGGVIVTPVKVIVGSSAIIAMRRPAQPRCLRQSDP